MYTIENDINNEIYINKSRFICICKNVMTEKDARDFIKENKKSFKDATHYCYAYIVGNVKRASDDGEPSGTAGIPILKVLENNNLNYVVFLVIRYFGGIKLGTGGLIRAYAKSASEALKTGKLIELIPGLEVDIIFPYEKEKLINHILEGSIIKNKKYGKDISYDFEISEENFNKVKEALISSTLGLSVYNNLLIKK